MDKMDNCTDKDHRRSDLHIRVPPYIYDDQGYPLATGLTGFATETGPIPPRRHSEGNHYNYNSYHHQSYNQSYNQSCGNRNYYNNYNRDKPSPPYKPQPDSQRRRHSAEHGFTPGSGFGLGFGFDYNYPPLDTGLVTPPLSGGSFGGGSFVGSSRPYYNNNYSGYTMAPPLPSQLPTQKQHQHAVYRKHTKKPSSQVLIPPIRPPSASEQDSSSSVSRSVSPTSAGGVSNTSNNLSSNPTAGSVSSSSSSSNKASNGAIARAAVMLAGAQFFGKLVTFGLNQALLRLIDPQVVGLSAQLELISATTVYFSREAVRLASQRLTLADKQPDVYLFEGGVMDGTVSGTIQEAMNIGFVPVIFGFPLSLVISTVYTRLSGAEGPKSMAIVLYGIASVVELLAEPCFLVSQLKLDFQSRASFESVAIMARCIVTFLAMLLLKRTSSSNDTSSILAFALGQLAYALIWTTLYISHSWKINRRAKYKFYGIQKVSVLEEGGQRQQKLYLDPYTVKLAASIWLQTLFKHCLTEGDKLIVSLVLPLSDQGVYSLVSNYGSLLARLVFLPIEETLRTYFSKLLSKHRHKSENTKKEMGNNGKDKMADVNLINPNVNAADSGWLVASDVLSNVLRAYSYLSILAVGFGPLCADFALQLLVSKAWSSTPNIGRVLATYACFIPFLAINGCLEAFVQSVASVQDIRKQGLAMVSFSASFALAAYIFMSPKFLGFGAQGLIYANMINMMLRIVWCIIYIDSVLYKHTPRRFLWLHQSIPGLPVLLTSGVCIVYAWTQLGPASSYMHVIKLVTLAMVIVSSVIYEERMYLADFFRRAKVKAKDKTA